MTKQHGPVLPTQTARATKKAVLALAILLGVQGAALAATAYDNGWQWNGECWCSHRNDPGTDQDRANAITQCTKTKCENAYGNPSQAYLSCMAGAADQADNQLRLHKDPVCSGGNN